MVTNSENGNFNLTLRSILSLAAGIGTILVLFIFGSNYAFFKFYKMTNDYQSKMEAFETLAYDANLTHVTLKTQVQEWKNILLRGFNKDDYDKYYSAFVDRRKEVQNQLDNLMKEAEQVGIDTTQIVYLKRQHEELIDLSDTLLANINLQDNESIHASDRQIRGKDRPLGDAFDKLAKEIKTITDQSKKDLVYKIQETTHSLKNLLWGSMAIAFILLFVMIVLILKTEKNRQISL